MFRGATSDLHGRGINEGTEEGISAPLSISREITGTGGEAHLGMMLSECCHLNRLCRAPMSQILTSLHTRSSLLKAVRTAVGRVVPAACPGRPSAPGALTSNTPPADNS